MSLNNVNESSNQSPFNFTQEEKKKSSDTDGTYHEYIEWVDFLKTVNSMQHLTDQQRITIAHACQLKKFNDGDIIVTEGDKANDFFIIVEGNAVVHQNMDNNELVEKEILAPTNNIGGKQIYLNEKYIYNVKAKGVVFCLKMNEQEFHRVLEPRVQELKERAAQYRSFIN